MKNQGKKKVLLIDDDANLLVTLGDFLKFEGYDVVTADSGEQGLKKLDKFTPDLIILDMSMPGMGGVGFLKQISSPDGKPKYPVLVLTARAHMAEFFANIEVDGFVSKPCDPNDVLTEVGRIIFLRSGSSPQKIQIQAEKKKVLLGEDNELVNENLTSAFTDAGYIVDTVCTGPEVLEKAIVGRPDIIVMKLVFSGMNGDNVANILKEMPNARDIPIILYDETNADVPETRYTESETGIKKLVRNNNSVSLLAAVKDVLKKR